MSTASWQETWKFFVSHRDLMARAAAGVLFDSAHTQDETMDLVHSFALERLPRLLWIVRDLPQKEATRYLSAAVRNYTRDALRRGQLHTAALHHMRMLEESGHPPGASDSELDLSRLHAAMVTLHDNESIKVAKRYFGFDGPRRSVRELAEDFGLSRHSARRAVLDAVLMISVQMGVIGALTHQEVEACRAVLLDGASPVEAAERLNLNSSQVRAALNRARELLAHQIG